MINPGPDETGTWHEEYKAGIFVHGRFLGFITYDSGREDLGYHRGGYAFFCQYCGEVWGKFDVKDAAGRRKPFKLEPVSCAFHPGDQWTVAGSMLNGLLVHLLDDWPPAALKREFEIHMNKETA